jgi:hypothetical protein
MCHPALVLCTMLAAVSARVGWAIVLVSGSRTDVVKAKPLLRAICDRGSEEACALSKSMPR